MNECIELNHAELVPTVNLKKPPEETFYLPRHAVHKEESTTTNLRVVFDASAKLSTGVSLDHLMEYPLTAKNVEKSFYADDGLTGADSVPEAIELQRQLQDLFNKGTFSSESGTQVTPGI